MQKRKRRATVRKTTRRIAKEVLVYLAQEKSSWYYKVYKKIVEKLEKERREKRKSNEVEVSWSTLWQTLDILRKQRFISVQERTKIGGKGHLRTPLSITFHGLLAAFLFKDTWKYLDDIRKKHVGKLPLLFGKWDHFNKYNVEDAIIEQMQSWYQLLPPRYFFDTDPKDDELMDKIKKQQKRKNLYDYVLFYPLAHARRNDEALKWAEMIAADPDLKSYVHERFDYFIQLGREDLKRLRLRKALLSNLEN